MNIAAVPALSKVPQVDNPKYHAIFEQFEHFSNYIHFAIEFLTPEIWVDNEEHPTLACFYAAPAYFLWGDPDAKDASSLLQMLPADSWLIPSSSKWDQHLTKAFGEKLIAYQRSSFDSASLSLEHLRTLKSDLPDGLRLVPIDETHVGDPDNMLCQDLLSKYFTGADFLQRGGGFCLLDQGEMVGFAAANYPTRDRVLEVYIRVDYNDDPRHRQKGCGTQLAVALLEDCLQKGLIPEWDAANDVSVRLALKLGYTLHHQWTMYHLT